MVADLLPVFKVLVITFKAPCRARSRLSEKQSHPDGIGPPYLVWQEWEALDSVGQGIVAAEIQWESLFAVAPALWNVMPLEVRSALALLAFRKNLTLPTGLGPQWVVVSFPRWLVDY